MTAIPTEILLRLTMERARALARPPVSTYRLQFHSGFTFKDATEIVPYLTELGISHVYASPYLVAVAGSKHGYDVIDPRRLNPEIGSEEDYEEFLRALDRHGMSHILDTVPNHMGVETNDNAWWNSVLELGRGSPFADFFDISWRDTSNSDVHDRVLMPVLGEPYGKVLESGQLKLVSDREGTAVFLEYFKRRFPVDPSTFGHVFDESHLPDDAVAQALADVNGTVGNPHSFDRLDALLFRQHYRLAWWRVASQEINYRRFFDINGLAALAMEREHVFSAVHEFTLRLAAQGKITGLRVDHPDGLYNPREYFRRLQKYYLLAIAKQIAGDQFGHQTFDWREMETALDRRISEPASRESSLYVVAEKILAFGESLPADWQCEGTSGYDFLVMVNTMFVERAHEERFTQIYRSITGTSETFDHLACAKKQLVLKQSFSSELRRLTELLKKLGEKTRRARDFTFQALQDGLGELIAVFPVYRTYIESPVVSDADQAHLLAATERAIGRNPGMLPDLFYFIRDMLLQQDDDSFDDGDRNDRLRFAGRFQQLTSPATAKGVEDTAFYVFQRLISLNEVGGDPSRFGIDADELHQYLLLRQRHWPHALSALSTHDTKRSEDARARLNVLSEIPGDWEAHVNRWIALNARHRRTVNHVTAPAPDEEYLLYQTLAGIWPFDGAADDLAGLEARVQQFMQKAMREAKLRTNWTQPDEAWEGAMKSFIADLFDPGRSEDFLRDMGVLVRKISPAGLVNSLAQTLIRIAAPGVPDTYQGTELWDFSLVDPDNRRPVDYQLRRRWLEEFNTIDTLSPAHRAAEVRKLLERMEDGRIKLWTIRQALHCRMRHPWLFSVGQYVPVAATGLQSDRVFAFARFHETHCALCIAPIRTAHIISADKHLPVGSAIWGDAQLELPERFGNVSLENALTGERIVCGFSDRAIVLRLSEISLSLPIALFVGEIQSSK
jgi:(1->4)-alpha-D-glucan 1-alpha-D-glucosylmutase